MRVKLDLVIKKWIKSINFWDGNWGNYMINLLWMWRIGLIAKTFLELILTRNYQNIQKLKSNYEAIEQKIWWTIAKSNIKNLIKRNADFRIVESN